MRSQNFFNKKMLEWNIILSTFNNTTSIKQFTNDFIELSNGLIFVRSEHEYILLWRRLRNKTFNHDLLFDLVYNVNMTDEDRRKKISEMRSLRSSEFNKLHYQSLSEEDKAKSTAHLTTIKKIYREQVKSGKKPPGRKWNKGLTKHTNETIRRCSELLSANRKGKNNPSWGSHVSEANKLSKSKLIKQRILDGIWTPHTHNSLSRCTIVYKGKKYRSSWEALFHQINPNMVYEKLRIKYSYNGNEHIYIVDFVDLVNNKCIEIKPTERVNDLKNIAKQQALQEYCDANGFLCEIVTQAYFIDNWDKFDLTTITNITRTKMRQINYEANKKGIYNQTFDSI